MNALFVSFVLVLTAVLPLRAAASGFEWRSFADDNDQISLWRDGMQLGNYRRSTALYYPRRGPGQWGDPCAPPCPPPDAIESDGTLNFGLESERMKRPGQHQLNGREVSRAEVLEALGGAGLHDDSDHLFLTIIGDEAQRRQVRNDLDAAPPLAAWKGRLKVHDYEPTHWALQEAGFKTDGRPTLYVQAPDGKVLHRQDDYRGPLTLAEALRRADSRYRPDHDPDLNRDLAGGTPVVWIGAALLAVLLLWKGDGK